MVGGEEVGLEQTGWTWDGEGTRKLGGVTNRAIREKEKTTLA